MSVGPGRAIFLVGPSSAGKSSLGNALVEILSEPFLFFETDRCGLRGPTGRPELVTIAREELVSRGAAFAIRGYLEAGLDLVVEAGLWHVNARRMAAAVFEPYDAWLVGLRWDIAELERREAQRSDGIFPGTARSQATAHDAWAIPYDLVVDAVGKTPAGAAQEIVDWLATDPTPRGMKRIAGSGGARRPEERGSRPWLPRAVETGAGAWGERPGRTLAPASSRMVRVTLTDEGDRCLNALAEAHIEEPSRIGPRLAALLGRPARRPRRTIMTRFGWSQSPRRAPARYLAGR